MKIREVMVWLVLGVPLIGQASELRSVGQGAWRQAVSSGDNSVPEANFRTAAMKERAAPTNQWYSSVMFTRWSEVLHAVPLSAKASPRGLEVGFPQKSIVPTERKDVEVVYAHTPDVTLRPLAFEPQAALLAGHSDWAVDIAFEAQDRSLLTTLAHGSPFVYARLSHGDLALDLAAGLTAQPWSADARVLLISGSGKLFAAFAPTGGRWHSVAGSWHLQLPPDRRYVSLAVLPDRQEATLAQFLANAYSHIVDTRADYRIDSASSEVITRFSTKTKTWEGPEGSGILGLYPHHYHGNPTLTDHGIGRLASIRGPIALKAAASFETRHRYTGFVPYWPGVRDASQSKAILGNLSKESRRARRMMLEIGQGLTGRAKACSASVSS